MKLNIKRMLLAIVAGFTLGMGIRTSFVPLFLISGLLFSWWMYEARKL